MAATGHIKYYERCLYLYLRLQSYFYPNSRDFVSYAQYKSFVEHPASCSSSSHTFPHTHIRARANTAFQTPTTMATTEKGGRPASGIAKPLMNDEDRKIAELEAILVETQAKLEETEKQFDVEMYACGLNYQDMITKFSDFIEKVVANTSVRLHAQRRTHNALYNIAVTVSHWNDELKNGRERVMISRAEVDEIKSWVKAVADHDAVRVVDNLLEHMCKDANHWAHDVAQQVILELEETATDKREIIGEIGKRYSLVTHQTHMILDKDAFSRDEKRDRIKHLADDIAAQIKINPGFDFDDTIVPHVTSSSQKAIAEPLATTIGIGERVDELLFPDRIESSSIAIPPTESTVRPAPDKAKLHTEIAELKAALEAERETTDSVGNQLASSVLSIMIQLDFQRRINQGLVELAEHLNAYFKGTRSLPGLLSELRLATVVQRLADGDQVTNIDDQLHGLCYNTGHAVHQIGRQVLSEYRDGENPNDEELLTAMRERLQDFGAQLKLAQEIEAVNDDACTSVKSRAFIRDMQVQFQSGTAFSFGDDTVPFHGGDPEEDILNAGLSVAEEVRRKLSLRDSD